MELSSSNIKKNYISGNGTVHFPAQAQRNKKIRPLKIPYVSKISSSNIKKKKLESFSYILSKKNFSYISRNGTLHFSARARKIKKIHPEKNFLYFRKTLKKLHIFLKRNLYLCFGKGELRFLN